MRDNKEEGVEQVHIETAAEKITAKQK